MLPTLLAALAAGPALALAAPTFVTSPQFNGYLVHPYSANDGRCLTVVPNSNGQLADGNLVVPGACEKNFPSPYQAWDIARGRGFVKVKGTNFCLDAGTNPHNNVQMKIWTCYQGLQQQDWFYTDDDRIAIFNGNQCLDLGGSVVQTYQCTTGNTNQIWKLSGGPPPPPASSTSVPPVQSSTSVAPPPTSTSSSVAPPPPAGTFTPFHPNGISGLCLTVVTTSSSRAFDPRSGDLVQLFACSEGSTHQNWLVARGDGKICLRAAPGYCLDAGVSPSNGVALKVWEKLDVPQQRWYYTNDQHVAITGGNQCMDLRDGNKADGTTVQTWQCGNNINQIWTVPGI